MRLLLILSFAASLQAQLATDNFNRASLGANWTTVTGQSNCVIPGTQDRVQTASVGSDCVMYNNTVTWPNDQYAQIKATSFATSSARFVGVILRASAAANTFYRCGVEGPPGASATTVIGKTVAGAFTSLSSGTNTVNANDTLKCQIVGSNITLYVNGVSTRTATDSSIASGNAGMMIFVDTGSAPDATGDDWEGGSASSGAAVAPRRPPVSM